jgi:hypothetical protein
MHLGTRSGAITTHPCSDRVQLAWLTIESPIEPSLTNQVVASQQL